MSEFDLLFLVLCLGTILPVRLMPELRVFGHTFVNRPLSALVLVACHRCMAGELPEARYVLALRVKERKPSVNRSVRPHSDTGEIT